MGVAWFFRLRLWTIFLVAGAQVGLVSLAQGGSLCHDFLDAIHKKPRQLEFQSCKPRTDLQGALLEATYRVAGIHAAYVESYLSRELKLKKLKHNCCLWESTENSYRDKDGRVFMISMATEENIITSRSQWAQIPYFYVVVQWDSQEP